MLYAEARLGEMLAEIPDFHSSGKGTMKRKELPEVIDKKQSHYAQELSRHEGTKAELPNITPPRAGSIVLARTDAIKRPTCRTSEQVGQTATSERLIGWRGSEWPSGGF